MSDRIEVYEWDTKKNRPSGKHNHVQIDDIKEIIPFWNENYVNVRGRDPLCHSAVRMKDGELIRTVHTVEEVKAKILDALRTKPKRSRKRD